MQINLTYRLQTLISRERKSAHTLPKAEKDWAQLFLDLLDSKRATKMRQQFASVLIRYHDTPDWKSEVFTQGRRREFVTFLNGFLDEHGANFFCERQRSHLVMG